MSEAEIIPLRPGVGDEPIRTLARPPFCDHAQTELDAEAQRVYCQKCGREVPAFDALLRLAEQFERYANARDHAMRQAESAEEDLADVERRLKNAKARLRRAEGPLPDAMPIDARALRALKSNGWITDGRIQVPGLSRSA